MADISTNGNYFQNAYHTTLCYLFFPNAGHSVRWYENINLRHACCQTWCWNSKLQVLHNTAKWTNLVHWKVLYMVYFLLLHWSEFLYQSLHKLSEWMNDNIHCEILQTTFLALKATKCKCANARDFYTELIFYFPLYFLYLFHMKYLYRMSMCEAKTPNCSSPAGNGFDL